jgi:hypothetical protein
MGHGTAGADFPRLGIRIAAIRIRIQVGMGAKLYDLGVGKKAV